MPDSANWTVSYRPGGWVRLQSDAADEMRVYLKLDFADPRPEIRCAIMTSQERISARSWRQVPFDDIEVQALLTIGRLSEILRQPGEVAWSPDDLEKYFADTEDAYGHIRGEATGAYMVGPFENSEPRFVQTRTLAAPERPIPDDFYENLAEVYTGMVANKTAPAPAIAQQTGVSVRTVHGWISEARKRGHLPPARRGRPG